MRRQLKQAPFPKGAAEGSLPGDWPVLVTIIGEATAIGYQTLTTDLTLGAQLARRIDRDSRRGVRWQALITSDYTIRTAQKLFRDNPQLILAVVVVVLLEIGDSFRFTPPWVWRKPPQPPDTDHRPPSRGNKPERMTTARGTSLWRRPNQR